MAKVSGIEIQGLDQLQRALKGLPEEVNASVIRNIARKPANKIVSLARKKFTRNKTGRTKRSFGILKIKNQKQKFLEIGVKGRSLAWIHLSGAVGRKKKSGAKTGDIDALGNIFQDAAGEVGATVTKEMSVDIGKIIGKGLRKYGVR
jgi:hypothetical protein